MMHANKQALKYIHKTNKRNQSQTTGKELVIPIGNHVLLHEPNVYYIKLLSAHKDAQPKVVN